MGVIKGAFVGEKNFDVIKMHGTTIKIINIFIHPVCSLSHCTYRRQEEGYLPNLFHYRFSFSIGLAHAPTEQFHLCIVI